MAFYLGDKVRFGKGEVEYTVADEGDDGLFYLVGQKSSRKAPEHKLTLVKAGPARKYAERVTEVETDEQAAKAREGVREYSGLTEFTEAGHEHQESEYGRTILKALQFRAQVFLGLGSRSAWRKAAKRHAKNKVAKASRKVDR